MLAWILVVSGMETTKVTIELSVESLARARESTGTVITGTIRQGLERVASRRAQDELRRLRGKVKFSVDLKAIRKDRR
jgi:cytochrome P450